VAAPVALYIQTPLDTGNTGKKVRTQTRVVGADTVHEHFFVPVSQREKSALSLFATTVFTVQAAATNGTTTGFFWLINLVGATKKIGVRRLEFIHQHFTNLTHTAWPRLSMARCTFTGTPSGATVTPVARDSVEAATIGSLRTASTGLTVTLGATMWSSMPFMASGTAGWTFTNPSMQEWEPPEEGQIILRAGEGLVFYQPDAGTTADTRRVVVNGAWEDFE
jgi:hypothetical protein